MTVSISNINRNLIVKIIGDIDHHTTEELRFKIDKEFKKLNCKNIIFDFSEVEFMDSSGIGMVIGRYRNIENAGGIVCVSSISTDAKRIFDVSGLHKIIKVYNNIDEALKNIQ